MARPQSIKLNPVVRDGKIYYLPNCKKLFKEPTLNANNDKCWFLYYSIWNFNEGKWDPIKDTSGDLNRSAVRQNKAARKITANEMVIKALGLLKMGINPKTGRNISPFSEITLEMALAGADDVSPVPTLRTAISEWNLLKSGAYDSKPLPENKENTARNYNHFFNKFLLYCEARGIADTRLNTIPKIAVQEFFEQRFNIVANVPYKEGKIPKSNKIGAATWNVQLGWIKAMFNYYAKKYDYQDYVKNIEDKPDPEDSERYEPFTSEQLKLILNHLDNPQEINRVTYKTIAPPDIFLGLVCRTIYYTFLRPSEIRRLKIKHVKNYMNGFFNLTTDITKTKKKIFNELYIQPALVDRLKSLGWEEYFNDKKYDDYYVFTSDMKPSIVRSNPYSYSKKFSIVLSKVGIPLDGRFSLYSLKPTGNIAAFNAGYDLFQISIQNRHTTTAQTETYLRKLKCNIAEKPRPLMSNV